MEKKKLTTASGRPYTENENSMTAGPRGPILLQDFILHEKMAHFNRERIPERVVHAKGSGIRLALKFSPTHFYKTHLSWLILILDLSRLYLKLPLIRLQCLNWYSIL